MINKEVILKLKPCQDRYDNYVTKYKDKSFTKSQFMGLKSITHFDKLWVAFRLMTKSQVIAAAADIAESVLHIFESEHPNDKRPRLAIEAIRSGKGLAEAHTTAIAAANAAVKSAFYAAYATYAVANAAYYADDASYNIARVACTISVTSCLSYDVDEDKKQQAKLVRKIILKHWKKEKKS